MSTKNSGLSTESMALIHNLIGASAKFAVTGDLYHFDKLQAAQAAMYIRMASLEKEGRKQDSSTGFVDGLVVCAE